MLDGSAHGEEEAEVTELTADQKPARNPLEPLMRGLKALSERTSAFGRIFLLPLSALDRGLAFLEGDRDNEVTEKARSFSQSQVDQSDELTTDKGGSKLDPRIDILPSSLFHVSSFFAPTKNLSEAKQIATLQLDQLTAIPAHEVIVAICAGNLVETEAKQYQFRLFVIRKKSLYERRQAGQKVDKVEAFVAFDPDEEHTDNRLAGVFRDDRALEIRVVRRLQTMSLACLCAAAMGLFFYSLEQRFDRDNEEVRQATRKAIAIKTEAVQQRARALEALTGFGKGSVEASADRTLIALAQIADRQPKDARLQTLVIQDGKVRLAGTALDPNAARLSFLTPKISGAGATKPPSVPAIEGSPSMPQSGATPPQQPQTPPTPPQQIAWQPFDVELPAPSVVGGNGNPNPAPPPLPAPNIPTPPVGNPSPPVSPQPQGNVP